MYQVESVESLIQLSLSLSLFQTPKEAVIGVAFSLSLAQEFPAHVQVLALLKLMDYLTSLPEEKPESMSVLLATSLSLVD